jgi:hypothetical protein
VIWRVLAFFVCVLPADAALAQRFAIAIGNNAGDADEEVLRWAEEDATRTHALFVELGDVAPEDALLLRGTSAEGVKRALVALRDRIARDHVRDAVLFAYFSGHGDARDLHLAGSHLPLRELEQLLRETRAGTLVTVVDACRDETPAGVRNKGARHDKPFDIQLWRERGRTGRVTITSAGYNEVAQESDQLRSSFFTHHLLSGMRGAADRDGDRQVNLDELYHYAYHHTLASSHAHLAAVQHPQLDVDLAGEGDLVITRLSHAQAVLGLPAAMGGDFLIVDDGSGDVVAQVFKAEGRNAQLALEPGRFRVQLRHDTEVYATEVGLEWGGRQSLLPESFERQELRDAQHKGRSLDPSQGLMFVGGRVGIPTVARRGLAWGGGARAAWELPNLRLVGEAQLSAAMGENAILSRTYFETRLGFGAGPRLVLAPVQIYVGATLGLLWVHALATRIARDDAVEVLGVPRHSSANALGPYLAPQLSFELPIGRFVAALQTELQLSVIRIDQHMTVQSTPSLMLALGRRF